MAYAETVVMNGGGNCSSWELGISATTLLQVLGGPNCTFKGRSL